MLKDNPVSRRWFKQESSLDAIADFSMIQALPTVLHKQTRLLKNCCIMFPFIRGFYLAFGFFSFEGENFSVQNDSILSCAIAPNCFFHLEPSIWSPTQQQQCRPILNVSYLYKIL